MSLNHFQFVTIIVVDKLNDDRQDPDRFPSLDIGFLVLLHGSQAGRQRTGPLMDECLLVWILCLLLYSKLLHQCLPKCGSISNTATAICYHCLRISPVLFPPILYTWSDDQMAFRALL